LSGAGWIGVGWEFEKRAKYTPERFRFDFDISLEGFSHLLF
jgi:hypothetical protein